MVPIHAVDKISKCHLYTEGTQKTIQTEGMNIQEIWKRAANFEMSKINITDVHEFARKYGVHAIPEMWLINQRGEVASTDISVEELEQKTEQLLSSGLSQK